MKKFFCILFSISILFSTFTISASAYTTEFINLASKNTFYNRTSARNYLNQYTRTPNSSYYNYSSLGGDCTNFVSQMARAGGMPMTPQKSNPTTNDWYYYGSNLPYRTSTWTGAHQFRQYWGVINGVGKKEAYAMHKYSARELKGNSAAYRNLVSRCELGDVIQFVDSSGRTFHSMGVQRVYVENGVRKVTISQHTPNNFYHLTEKIADLNSSYWVCLLKMRIPASSTATLQSVKQILGPTQVTSILSNVSPQLKSKLPIALESLSTDQLDTLYTALEAKNISDYMKDNQRWEAVATIGSILDARYSEKLSRYGDSAMPKTPITKELLINRVSDTIQMYEIVANLPLDIAPLDHDAAIITPAEERQQALTMLKKLTPFLTQAQSSLTDENLYDFWCTYWRDILKQPIPAAYTLDI